MFTYLLFLNHGIILIRATILGNIINIKTLMLIFLKCGHCASHYGSEKDEICEKNSACHDVLIDYI